MATKFDLQKIQEKWIRKWQKSKIFEAKPDPKKSKFYLTVAFPYPSGSMHIGHGRTYTVPDVIARFKRMQGYNVLFPMAWHVTGSPVVGIAERIKKKEEKALKIYGDLYKVPKETLETFTDPKNIVKYFSEEYMKNMTQMGYSIDWTRQFFSTTPQYSRFIEWQYKKLHEQDLVIKGEHPVRYCPSCQNPVGDHDLLSGESATINEFTVIKFTSEGLILPAATLRPETIFGVTNMWLNPSIVYKKVRINNEVWVLSEEAVEKLRYQDKKIEIVGEIAGSELIGKECTDPVGNKNVPILPAEFVDPNYATGVVMSVPAHAPYDYIALRDLNMDIVPITIIDIGNRAVPAREIVEQMNIGDQKDPKLNDATEILYREEHSKGQMKKSIENYGGMSVRDAREKLIEDLLNSDSGDIFYEFSEAPVICRCNTLCVIKILKDQWFLNYSNPEWKSKTHECLDQMKIIPKETKQNFSYFIDWLNDWACTRRVGLGTRLPWDKNWIIEPLSDSTIYMAYYTISTHLKDLDPRDLDTEFFDYIFLGGDNANKISDGVSRDKLDEIRDEFMYWYPPEWRLSAKDLVGNHLTFHLFHHTAIFHKRCWPRGMVVFGMGLLEGEKMSSSKGNVILLEDATENYGSDVIRLFLMSNAEPWQDFDWRDTLIKNTRKKLKQFYDQVNYAIDLENEVSVRDIDRWLSGRMQLTIKRTTYALENFQIRKALQYAFFDVLNDLNWYFRRCEPGSAILKEFADNWMRLMAPFTPFTCEELWERTNEGFVSLAPYPEFNEELVDQKVIIQEDMIKTVIEDIKNILSVTHAKPGKIYLYLAPDWKRKLYKEIKDGKQIKDMMQCPELKANAKEVVEITRKIKQKEVPELLSLDEEYNAMISAKEFLEREFKAKINIERTVTYDPQKKARYSLPLRPGIYVV